MYPKIEMEDSLEVTENHEIFEGCVDKTIEVGCIDKNVDMLFNRGLTYILSEFFFSLIILVSENFIMLV